MSVDEHLLTAVMATGYPCTVADLRRIPAGTASENFHVHTRDGTDLFVKTYRPGTNLGYEQSLLEVAEVARQAGIPVPATHRDIHGHLLHKGAEMAIAVSQWHSNDHPTGPLSADQAHDLGRVLAKLHTHLRCHEAGCWPTARPRYRGHTHNQIIQRFGRLTRHLQALPARTDPDERNLQDLLCRSRQLGQLPELLTAAGSPMRALVHGDFVRPNWLLGNDGANAIVDFRLTYDDPVREIGRMAFDVMTVAATDVNVWLHIAEAALSGYLAEGGIMNSTQLTGCARLALLHNLCSTYPLEDLYLHPPPAHLHDDLHTYWANRVCAVTTMLTHLGDIDRMLARLAHLPVLRQPKPAATPNDPQQMLPVLATTRAHLLAHIKSNAKAAGVKALLLWGSGATGTADPLSDLDLIAIIDPPTDSPAAGAADDNPAGTQPGVTMHELAARLLEPAPLLFSRTVTHNGPSGGYYRGVCAQVAGWPIWVDLYARHEALWNRVEVRDLRLFAVAAARCSWGQSELRSGREDGKQPRQSQDGLVSPDGPGLMREIGRCTRGTRVIKPLNRSHQLKSGGYGLVSGAHPVRPRPSGELFLLGVHQAVEAMVNARGVAMARPQGYSGAPNQLNDSEVNVGTIYRCSCRWPPAGCRIGTLSAEGGGWGGGPVVVRAEESFVHGEGVQQIGREDAGMPGGPW